MNALGAISKGLSRTPTYTAQGDVACQWDVGRAILRVWPNVFRMLTERGYDATALPQTIDWTYLGGPLADAQFRLHVEPLVAHRRPLTVVFSQFTKVRVKPLRAELEHIRHQFPHLQPPSDDASQDGGPSTTSESSAKARAMPARDPGRDLIVFTFENATPSSNNIVAEHAAVGCTIQLFTYAQFFHDLAAHALVRGFKLHVEPAAKTNALKRLHLPTELGGGGGKRKRKRSTAELLPRVLSGGALPTYLAAPRGALLQTEMRSGSEEVAITLRRVV